MRGWPAPGSLSTAALLGVSGARNPLPTGSPSWGSRIGRAKAFCAQPQPCPLSQLGRSAPRPRRTDGPKRASGSCILQTESLLGQQTTAPSRRAQKSNASRFRHWPSALQRAKRGGAAPGSLGPAALLVVSGHRNPLPRGSPWWGSRFGHAKAFCAQAAAMHPEPARPLSARPGRTDKPKRASSGCIRQRESQLGQQSTAATRLSSGRQRKPFSPPALRSPEDKEGWGCPWLPGPCCFAGGLRCPKPTPHGFSLAGKQDWAREGLLRPGRSHAP